MLSKSMDRPTRASQLVESDERMGDPLHKMLLYCMYTVTLLGLTLSIVSGNGYADGGKGRSRMSQACQTAGCSPRARRREVQRTKNGDSNNISSVANQAGRGLSWQSGAGEPRAAPQGPVHIGFSHHGPRAAGSISTAGDIAPQLGGGQLAS